MKPIPKPSPLRKLKLKFISFYFKARFIRSFKSLPRCIKECKGMLVFLSWWIPSSTNGHAHILTWEVWQFNCTTVGNMSCCPQDSSTSYFLREERKITRNTMKPDIEISDWNIFVIVIYVREPLQSVKLEGWNENCKANSSQTDGYAHKNNVTRVTAVSGS